MTINSLHTRQKDECDKASAELERLKGYVRDVERAAAAARTSARSAEAEVQTALRDLEAEKQRHAQETAALAAQVQQARQRIKWVSVQCHAKTPYLSVAFACSSVQATTTLSNACQRTGTSPSQAAAARHTDTVESLYMRVRMHYSHETSTCCASTCLLCLMQPCLLLSCRDVEQEALALRSDSQAAADAADLMRQMTRMQEEHDDHTQHLASELQRLRQQVSICSVTYIACTKMCRESCHAVAQQQQHPAGGCSNQPAQLCHTAPTETYLIPALPLPCYLLAFAESLLMHLLPAGARAPAVCGQV